MAVTADPKIDLNKKTKAEQGSPSPVPTPSEPREVTRVRTIDKRVKVTRRNFLKSGAAAAAASLSPVAGR